MASDSKGMETPTHDRIEQMLYLPGSYHMQPQPVSFRNDPSNCFGCFKFSRQDQFSVTVSGARSYSLANKPDITVSETEFLAVLKEHQNVIYKLVHLYASSEEDKKDLYQEIVLQAWKSYPSFRREARFSTWLYRLCLNTIFTIQRKTHKIDYTDTAKYEEQLTTANTSDEKDRLYKAMRTLSETERAVVSLHLDGYHNREVGELLGITANAVAVKLHRAKQQLTTILKNI